MQGVVVRSGLCFIGLLWPSEALLQQSKSGLPYLLQEGGGETEEWVI